MCDLEGGVRRQRFGQVGACAIEHKVRQVSSYKILIVSHESMNPTWTTLPLTSFVSPSTEPGLGKSRDCLHAENLLKRFVKGATADERGVEDDDDDASSFCGGGEDMTVDDDARALPAIIAQILAFPFWKEFACGSVSGRHRRVLVELSLVKLTRRTERCSRKRRMYMYY